VAQNCDDLVVSFCLYPFTEIADLNV